MAIYDESYYFDNFDQYNIQDKQSSEYIIYDEEENNVQPNKQTNQENNIQNKTKGIEFNVERHKVKRNVTNNYESYRILHETFSLQNIRMFVDANLLKIRKYEDGYYSIHITIRFNGSDSFQFRPNEIPLLHRMFKSFLTGKSNIFKAVASNNPSYFFQVSKNKSNEFILSYTSNGELKSVTLVPKDVAFLDEFFTSLTSLLTNVPAIYDLTTQFTLYIGEYLASGIRDLYSKLNNISFNDEKINELQQQINDLRDQVNNVNNKLDKIIQLLSQTPIPPNTDKKQKQDTNENVVNEENIDLDDINIIDNQISSDNVYDDYVLVGEVNQENLPTDEDVIPEVIMEDTATKIKDFSEIVKEKLNIEPTVEKNIDDKHVNIDSPGNQPHPNNDVINTGTNDIIIEDAYYEGDVEDINDDSNNGGIVTKEEINENIKNLVTYNSQGKLVPVIRTAGKNRKVKLHNIQGHRAIDDYIVTPMTEERSIEKELEKNKEKYDPLYEELYQKVTSNQEMSFIELNSALLDMYRCGLYTGDYNKMYTALKLGSQKLDYESFLMLYNYTTEVKHFFKDHFSSREYDFDSYDHLERLSDKLYHTYAYYNYDKRFIPMFVLLNLIYRSMFGLPRFNFNTETSKVELIMTNYILDEYVTNRKKYKQEFNEESGIDIYEDDKYQVWEIQLGFLTFRDIWTLSVLYDKNINKTVLPNVPFYIHIIPDITYQAPGYFLQSEQTYNAHKHRWRIVFDVKKLKERFFDYTHEGSTFNIFYLLTKILDTTVRSEEVLQKLYNITSAMLEDIYVVYYKDDKTDNIIATEIEKFVDIYYTDNFKEFISRTINEKYLHKVNDRREIKPEITYDDFTKTFDELEEFLHKKSLQPLPKNIKEKDLCYIDYVGRSIINNDIDDINVTDKPSENEYTENNLVDQENDNINNQDEKNVVKEINQEKTNIDKNQNSVYTPAEEFLDEFKKEYEDLESVSEEEIMNEYLTFSDKLIYRYLNSKEGAPLKVNSKYLQEIGKRNHAGQEIIIGNFTFTIEPRTDRQPYKIIDYNDHETRITKMFDKVSQVFKPNISSKGLQKIIDMFKPNLDFNSPYHVAFILLLLSMDKSIEEVLFIRLLEYTDIKYMKLYEKEEELLNLITPYVPEITTKIIDDGLQLLATHFKSYKDIEPIYWYNLPDGMLKELQIGKYKFKLDTLNRKLVEKNQPYPDIRWLMRIYMLPQMVFNKNFYSLYFATHMKNSLDDIYFELKMSRKGLFNTKMLHFEVNEQLKIIGNAILNDNEVQDKFIKWYELGKQVGFINILKMFESKEREEFVNIIREKTGINISDFKQILECLAYFEVQDEQTNNTGF